MKHLMTKKIISTNVFSAITKNLNWEILTKNLVTFKRWDGGEWNVLMLWGFPEKSDFQVEVHEKPVYRRELPKKVGLGNL